MAKAFDWSGSGSQRREQGTCLPPLPATGPELPKYRAKYVKRAGMGKGKGRRISWPEAIKNAQTNAELSSIGRNLSVSFAAGKLSEYQFATLVQMGKDRRQALARCSRQ